MGIYARRVERFLREVRKSIFRFAESVKFQPSEQQAELFKAVQAGEDRIACKSGQGPGKTSASSIIGMWKVLCRAYTLGIVTAPTMRQCEDVWLSEARKWYLRGDPLLRECMKITKTKIIVAGQDGSPGKGDWTVRLVTATKPENMQGLHNDHLFFIVEEASGVKRELWEQIEGTLSQPEHRGRSFCLQIGNPNTRDCAFFDCFNSDRDRWHCITWNAEQSPNVNQEQLEYFEIKYGKNSDFYRVRVLGEFPYMNPNCVMSSEDLDACTRTDLLQAALDCPPGMAPKQFGLDFARFGSDENVVFRRSGLAISEWDFFERTDPSRCVDRAFQMQRLAGWKGEECWFVADAGGMGQGVMHRFYEGAPRQVWEFHSQNVSGQPLQYENAITEAYFHVAGLSKQRRIRMPNDRRLIHQLANRQYSTTRKGLLVLESKDDFLKRFDDSPDRADAFCLAFYPVATAARMASRPAAGKRVGGTTR